MSAHPPEFYDLRIQVAELSERLARAIQILDSWLSVAEAFALPEGITTEKETRAFLHSGVNEHLPEFYRKKLEGDESGS